VSPSTHRDASLTALRDAVTLAAEQSGDMALKPDRAIRHAGFGGVVDMGLSARLTRLVVRTACAARNRNAFVYYEAVRGRGSSRSSGATTPRRETARTSVG